MTTAEQVTEPHAHHGEGPVWHSGWDALKFVDMLAGDICTVDVDSGGIERFHVGSVAAAFRPRTSGGLVVAVERGFALVDADGNLEQLGDLWSDEGVRMNEGGCDPQGRFYCGSMAYDATPGAGTVWRLDADRSTSVALERVTISNGLAWSLDGALAYYIDTPTGRVDAFEWDADRGFGTRRTVVEIPSGSGGPDGMTVDAEGGLWVALWGGSAVHRYTPDGRLDEVVELPVTQVTACTFGGPDLDELYVTTSRQGLVPSDQPAAGAVFRARPGVRGRAVQAYDG